MESGEWCAKVRYSPFSIEDKMNKYHFAVCINNTDYPASLEQFKIYGVLHDDQAAEDGDIRVIDESGEDYLYPAEYFVPIKVPARLAQALLRVV